MKERISWSRVAVEGVVIVGSILLAFAIDAWWDQLGEAEEERAALAGLESDFSGYIDALARIRTKNERRIDAARRIMAATGSAHAPLSVAEFQSDLAVVVTYNPISLQPGTLGSLLETNRLSWISNAQLRSRLVDWDRYQPFAGEGNRYMVEQASGLDAFLKRRYPMEGILLLTQDAQLDASEANSRFPATAASLLTDVEFANHIAYAADASRIVVRRAEILEGQANEILNLLRTENSD
ncbi:hypothetical protein [Arenimonas aestuarii]